MAVKGAELLLFTISLIWSVGDISVSDLRSRPLDFLGQKVRICGSALRVVNNKMVLIDRNQFVEVGVLVGDGIVPRIVSQKICLEGHFLRVDGKTKLDVMSEGELVVADALFDRQYRIEH